MNEVLFLNSEVSKIVGITPRQVLSWTEKGLVFPERPAKKAGSMRGYSYKNLLEFGLAKYLIDVIRVQFFTAKTILDDLRDDGEIEVWSSNYAPYRKSFSFKRTDNKNDLLDKSHMSFRENDPRGIEGTLESIPLNFPKQEKEDGTLYYIFMDDELDKPNKETLRIISPWTFAKTFEALETSDDFYEILESKGMIVVNLGKIKKEIDDGLKGLKK